MKATTTRQISTLLRKHLLIRLQSMSKEEVVAYLADTVYQERKRLEEYPQPEYEALLTSATKALQGSKKTIQASLLNLTNFYVEEIHTHFSNRTYDLVSKIMPSALSRLLTAAHPFQLIGSDFDPASRMNIQGPIEQIKYLAKHHTLVYAPTHVSNLDSPLIGYALQSVGLPPVLYGAGLNLFSNPLMSFFLSRLGAYTVDRRKNNRLYKDVLKAYSAQILGLGHHSLFYPGGTRSRDGTLEQNVKKGLLGTAIEAWQQNIQMGRSKEILIVPCTITSSLVLEAETLIDDALASQGKSRYIISDDEFSERRTLATFARKVLNLDASIYIRFSQPLDCVGNPVDDSGTSLDPLGQKIDRKAYICDDKGQVVEDAQRDKQYTNRLADELVKSYQRDSIVLPTHLVAKAALMVLQNKHPHLDKYQLALLSSEERTVPTIDLIQMVDHLAKQIRALKLHHTLPNELPSLIEGAYQQFALFHRERAVIERGDHIVLNSKLAQYYGNRLAHIPLTPLGE